MTAVATGSAARPRGLPLVGHVPAFVRDRLGFLTSMARRHGDAVWLRIGGPVLLINAPDDVRHVLTSNARNYEKTPRMVSSGGRALLGEGVLTSTGEEHLRQRRALLPLFQGKALRGFHEALRVAIERRLNAWGDGGTFDVAEEMTTLARDAIVAVAFGADFQDADGQMAWAIQARRRYIRHVFLANPLERLSGRPRREHDRAMEILGGTIRRVLAAGSASTAPANLTQRLGAVRYADGTSMSNDLIHDEIVTLLVTGHETIAEALSWTWYLLARNPAVRIRLEGEIARAVPGGFPSIHRVDDLSYALRVVQESMRLFPPTWIFIRIAAGRDRLPSGAEVPAGAKIYLCPWVTHRDPRHFPDPERFDPDRFTFENERTQPRIAYFPFGAGTHLCVGEQLARLEMTLAVAAIAARYRLELPDGHVVEPEPAITLAPRGGLPMHVVPR